VQITFSHHFHDIQKDGHIILLHKIYGLSAVYVTIVVYFLQSFTTEKSKALQGEKALHFDFSAFSLVDGYISLDDCVQAKASEHNHRCR